MSLQNIFDECALNISSYKPLSGGDISSAYKLYDGKKKYFLKVNEAAAYQGMFSKEANGLAALRANSSIIIPQVLKHGTIGRQQYLLMELLERGVPAKKFWEDFGKALAEMHQQKQPFFGWHEDNYIGSLPQVNTVHDTWAAFFRECRIMPLVKQLHKSNLFSNTDVSLAEQLCNKLDQIFPPELPALLHGDLWSGNYLTTPSGQAAIFDPAVYCGHREMDIGMTLLFGGFDDRFYQAYNETYPLEQNWRYRTPLTQLYPLLVHAILFGGHYIGNALSVMKKYAS